MRKICGLAFVFMFIFSSFCLCVGCKKTENGHSRYEIIAEYVPENKTLTGVVKVSFENVTDNELSVLKFQLY